MIGFLSLEPRKRCKNAYLRLTVNAVSGVGLCLLPLIDTNPMIRDSYLRSSWMLPTICIVLFVSVVSNHLRIWSTRVEEE